jgi:S-adenosylmethionine-diacylglycerol 3-amino-3-carboxypropyl transferase
MSEPNLIAPAAPAVEPQRRLHSEVAARADFSLIRYAQCWEDADILLEALGIAPGDECLAIGSAGDNALAMLARAPARVVVLDLNPAQLACLELRVAAYRELDYHGLLELIGSRPSDRRSGLYQRCRGRLSATARRFWDAHPEEIAGGIGGAGKFERYFATFRTRVLPLVHSRGKVERLLRGGTREERERFYRDEWDTWRWQLMFRLFFSRFVMGRMGRDPSFFRYVEGSVAERFLGRGRHALVELNPADNPYLQWILTGRHVTALPFALREENFEVIRANVDRLQWHCRSLEEFLSTEQGERFDAFNLSDIFEYISRENYHQVLDRVIRSGRSGARLAYWNTLAERRRPEAWSDRLRSLDEKSQRLHARDKAFFYCRFVLEEIV